MLDTIEVSCKTKHNIRLLAHFLYDTAFTLKSSSGGVGAVPGTIFSDLAIHSRTGISHKLICPSEPTH